MKKSNTLQMAHFLTAHPVASSVVILLLVLGLARDAAASGLVYEGFQYLLGQPLPTMNGGSGWAPGPWTGSAQMIDQPPTLSYPSALPSSGDALYNPAPGEAFRSFAAPFNNAASDLWISFQEETAFAGSGTFVQISSLGSFPAITVNKDGGGLVTLNSIPAGLSAGVGNVDFFVLQLVQFSGSTEINLYLDPGAALGAPSATFFAPTVFQASQFYFRTDPGQFLDEIRMGTTLQDVASIAVPEPSSITILAGGLLLFSVLTLFARGWKQKWAGITAHLPSFKHGATALILCLTVGKTELASAQFDPSLQFSPINNPNGVWTYGYESVPLGSPFKLLTLPLPVPSLPGPAIDSWQSPAFGTLGVYHNGTAASQTVTIGPETAIFNSGMLGMNAGPNDEYGIVQFTAPANGFYTIQGVFQGIDPALTISDVHLLWNNAVVATGNVSGFGPPSDVPLASGPFLLNLGDTLAFAVGGGPFNSMTALINAQVDAVAAPEPSSSVLSGLAFVLLAARGWFLRKQKVAIA
jgi:hypothetical protein